MLRQRRPFDARLPLRPGHGDVKFFIAFARLIFELVRYPYFWARAELHKRRSV